MCLDVYLFYQTINAPQNPSLITFLIYVLPMTQRKTHYFYKTLISLLRTWCNTYIN